MAFGLVALVDEARRLTEKRVGFYLARAWPLLAIALGYYFTPEHRRVLLREPPQVYAYLTHKQSREDYARFFYSPGMNYYQVDIDAVSDYLIQNAKREDQIVVRGFSPQVYAQTGMRCPSRFFWTNYIYFPTAYRRADFLEEDHAAIVRARPRYIATVTREEGRGPSRTRSSSIRSATRPHAFLARSSCSSASTEPQGCLTRTR